MPLATLYTNQPVLNPSPIVGEMTRKVAETLGKPESVTMVRIVPEATLAFGGDLDQPAALFEIEGIEIPDDVAETLTCDLCSLAEKQLATPANRVFVKLTNVPRGLWGGNNKVY